MMESTRDDERADLQVLDMVKVIVRSPQTQAHTEYVSRLLMMYLIGDMDEATVVKLLDKLIAERLSPSDKPKWECPGK